MGAVARSINVTYNGYSITTVVGRPTYTLNGTDFTFSCEFLLTAATTTALETAVDAARGALNRWNKNFTYVLNSRTIASHSHTTNTGMLTRGECNQIGDIKDTPQSALMSFSVRGILPGTETGNSGGFRKYDVSTSWDASRRRTVTFQMEYTAGSSNESALTKWEDATDGAKALATTKLTALGGNYDLINESIPEEDQSKHIVSGTLTYRERFIPETAGGGTDDDFIIDDLKFSRRYGSESYTKGQVAVFYDVSFEAALDVEQTTNNYDDMYTVYEDQIKPFLKQHLKDAWLTDSTSPAPAHNATIYILEDRPEFDTAANRIRASWTCLCPAATKVLKLDIETTDDWDSGEIYRKIHDSEHYTYAIYGEGAKLTLTERIMVEQLDSGWEPNQIPTGNSSALIQSLKKAGANFRLKSVRLINSKKLRGHYQDVTAKVYARTWLRTWEYVAPLKSSATPTARVFT